MRLFLARGKNNEHTRKCARLFQSLNDVSFNMFNINEAIKPKQREKTVDDNTGTIAMSAELLGASVYMWNEGSHSSDVCWFRAKLEWGKGGQDENA